MIIAAVTMGTESGTFFQTVNPATGELVQIFEAISGDDLEVALATAHKAYETDWHLRPVAVSSAATASPPRFRGEDNVAALRRDADSLGLG
jgi:acyl-CoA reductase-like NAD-dependent aldehyde dehydrogenase